MNSEKMDSPFVERLKLLLNGAKPYPWAAKVGITQATFNRMWKDGIAPKADILLLISENTGCSIDWLLTGKGPMKRGQAGYSLAEVLQNADASGERPETFEQKENIADRSPIKAAAVSYIDQMSDVEASDIVKIIIARQQNDLYRGMTLEGQIELDRVIREQIAKAEAEEKEKAGSSSSPPGLRITGT